MHCPACGQQQVSNETKFCSRCGMPLSVVAEVVAYGGYLPQLAELSDANRKWFTRRNGLGFSAIWFVFFIFLAVLFGGIANIGGAGEVLSALAIFGTVMIFISSLIFLKPERKYSSTIHTPAFAPVPNVGALPPQQAVPVNAYGAPQAGNWRDTNDLQPSSVVESTTRLLNDQERK